MKKLILLLSVSLAGIAEISAQDTDPTAPPTTTDAASIKLKVYKVALSTNADCTNPSTIFESTAGVEEDLLAKPTFAKGKIPHGTYRCIMVEVSKLIKTSGTATCTTAQNNLICPDSQESRLIGAGANMTCNGGTGTDQKVVAYFTTLSSASTGSRVLLPPLNSSDTTSGLALSAPLVFPTKKKAAIKLKKQILHADCSAATPAISITIE